MRVFSLTEYSIKIGKNKNYFSFMKNKHKKKFRFISFLGRKDLSKGYFALERKMEDYKNEILEFVYSFDNTYQAATAIAKHSKENVNNVNSWIISVQCCYSERINMQRYKYFKKYLRIIRGIK